SSRRRHTISKRDWSSDVCSSNLQLRQAVESEAAGIIWIETPSNPKIKVTDIAKVVKIAEKAGAVTIVDNTTATPVLQNPLLLGRSEERRVGKCCGYRDDRSSGKI